MYNKRAMREICNKIESIQSNECCPLTDDIDHMEDITERLFKIYAELDSKENLRCFNCSYDEEIFKLIDNFDYGPEKDYIPVVRNTMIHIVNDIKNNPNSIYKKK